LRETDFIYKLLKGIRQTCHQLEELHLILGVPIPSAELSDCAPFSKSLKKITMSSCSQLEDEQLKYFVKIHPNLEYLSLLNAPRITDNFLMDLPTSAPQLQVFITHKSSNISKQGIQNICKNLKSLEWIKVIACSTLTLGAFEGTGFESELGAPMAYSSYPEGLGRGYRKRHANAFIN
jgi:hypothetical protein